MECNKEKVSSLINKSKERIKKSEVKQKDKKSLFNVFSILRNEREEVLLHSRFIYELLNVNGTHQMGAIFLKRFLNTIKFEIEEFDLAKAQVRREYENIDILICLDNKAIIIENKIDALDQDNQLNRYNNILFNFRWT